MRAAVANGARAVYFGLEEFNARRRATNFTLAGLPATMRYLHAHNVKGYVAFNTLVFTDELPRAADYIRQIIEAGTDALIVQDLGIVRLIRDMAPGFAVHASTQTTQTHPEGIALLAGLGISRVILARELSIAEIAGIARATDVELEVFVHGAMCVSYSGQCLASESFWGRSGNRGTCGQACRLPYALLVDGREQPAASGEHLLSPHDLAAYDHVGQLLSAGVSAFKIEGRLKNAQYVACITAIYQDALAAATRGERFALSVERRAQLDQSFSRGFTCGFLDGEHHQDFVGADSPRGRGVPVGTVVARTPRGVLMRCEPPGTCRLSPGDGVVLGETGSMDEAQGGRIYSVEPSSRTGGQYEITFGRGDVDLARVEAGDVVYKTDDPQVRRRIETSYARDCVVHRSAVTAKVTAMVGEPLLLVFTDDAGNQVQVRSDQPLERAVRHPLTLELLREQMSRLGDSPFELAAVELLGEGGAVDCTPAMAPKSLLNELRRRAVDALIQARAAAALHPVEHADALARLRSAGSIPPRVREAAVPRLHVLVRSFEQCAAVCEAGGVQSIYADCAHPSEQAAIVEHVRKFPVRLCLASPQILKPEEQRLLQSIAALRPDEVLIRNLASLAWSRREMPEALLIGDHSLNVVNDLAASTLLDAGLKRITLAYDLNLQQVAALAEALPGADLELIVHSRVPLFHTSHCVAAAVLSGGSSCRDCGRPCGQHVLHLRDRNGEEHPLRTDAAGRTTVFNSRAQSIAACRDASPAWMVSDWRIDLLEETGVHARELIQAYARMAESDVRVARELGRSNPLWLAGSLEHA